MDYQNFLVQKPRFTGEEKPPFPHSQDAFNQLTAMEGMLDLEAAPGFYKQVGPIYKVIHGDFTGFDGIYMAVSFFDVPPF